MRRSLKRCAANVAAARSACGGGETEAAEPISGVASNDAQKFPQLVGLTDPDMMNPPGGERRLGPVCVVSAKTVLVAAMDALLTGVGSSRGLAVGLNVVDVFPVSLERGMA